ncbi:MAG: CHAT domain-containing protein, partial [Caldilineaceae bacterium]
KLRFIQAAAETVVAPGRDRLLRDADATSEAMIAAAGQHRIVAFFGHAVFDRRYPMSSRLVLADGSLHASEIVRRLRMHSDLIVLAACESGRGHVLRGDEIMGLSRALLYAGTTSVLATLWPVHEIPTRLLVEHFFHQIRQHSERNGDLDPALGLARSQCWLRELTCAEIYETMTTWGAETGTSIWQELCALWQMTHPNETPKDADRLFAHPFFWSPYILIGDRRRG